MTTTALHRPERIVVGIDGSVASHAAVRWAITHARSGDTVTLARDHLTAATADLIVVGAGDHGRLMSAVLGSVSDHLARHARVPVLIVPRADATDSRIARCQ